MKSSLLTQQLSLLNPWWIRPNFRYRVILRQRYLKQVNLKQKPIILFHGARRVGKTYLMYALINQLLNQKVNPKYITFLTADAPLFSKLSLYQVLGGILTQRHFHQYIFIDEVQDIADWQKTLKFYYDNFPNVRFVVSGSSSLTLAKETYKLTGRFVNLKIRTLNLSEYLDFKQIKVPKSKKHRTQIVQDYLQVGGYPEVVLNQDATLLFNIIESTLYRDLLQHYGIRNVAQLAKIVDFLVEKVGNLVSLRRIAQQVGVSHESVRFYLDYLQDVLLIEKLTKFAPSARLTNQALSKYYLHDVGVVYHKSVNPKLGALVENAVYLCLKNHQFDVNYGSFNNQEIDFVISRQPRKIVSLVEVKYRQVITESEILKYLSLNQPITFIVRPDTQLGDWIAGYPEFKFVSLWDLLINQAEMVL